MLLLINTLFFAETSAIYNAKTPNITNLHTLVANRSPFFVTRVALLWKYQERDGSFLSEQGIVKCGELIYLFIYLFIYCSCLLIFRWFVTVAVVVVFLFCFLVFSCFTVLSKHFIIYLQLIWAEIIPVVCSNPDPIVAIWPAVPVTIHKVRISIVPWIVCNVDIMAPSSKSWKIVIVAVRGVLIVVVYVLFEISITVVVFQWV